MAMPVFSRGCDAGLRCASISGRVVEDDPQGVAPAAVQAADAMAQLHLVIAADTLLPDGC